jgi:hypothetical protein
VSKRLPETISDLMPSAYSSKDIIFQSLSSMEQLVRTLVFVQCGGSLPTPGFSAMIRAGRSWNRAYEAGTLLRKRAELRSDHTNS